MQTQNHPPHLRHVTHSPGTASLHTNPPVGYARSPPAHSTSTRESGNPLLLSRVALQRGKAPRAWMPVQALTFLHPGAADPRVASRGQVVHFWRAHPGHFWRAPKVAERPRHVRAP